MFDSQQKPKQDPDFAYPEAKSKPLCIESFQMQLKTYKVPNRSTEERYRETHEALGLYRVICDGLQDYDIPNGDYLVTSEFAEKLLRQTYRKKVKTGLMYSARRLSVEQYYEENKFIAISPPEDRISE